MELLARYGEELNAGWVISTDLQYNDKLTQLSPRTGRPEELCELNCSEEVDVVRSREYCSGGQRTQRDIPVSGYTGAGRG